MGCLWASRNAITLKFSAVETIYRPLLEFTSTERKLSSRRENHVFSGLKGRPGRKDAIGLSFTSGIRNAQWAD